MINNLKRNFIRSSRKIINILLILFLLISCKQVNNFQIYPYTDQLLKCKNGIDYLSKLNLRIIKELESILPYIGSLYLPDSSSNQNRAIYYICNEQGKIGITTYQGIKVNQSQMLDVIKFLEPLFLIKTEGFSTSVSQSQLIQNVAKNPSKYSDWQEANESSYKFRIKAQKTNTDSEYLLFLESEILTETQSSQ